MIPLLDILTPIIGKILDFIPDPQKKAEAQLKLQEELDSNSQAILDAVSKSDQGQLDVNKVEATNIRLFVSGWRPFVGWVCGSAFAWVYLLQPMLAFVLSSVGHPVLLPTIDFSQMSSVLFGMLGMGGLRTWEKVQGVASK